MCRLRLLFVGLFLLSLTGWQRARAQTASTPRFEAAACPFRVDRTLTEGSDLRCGYLIVPENRSVANGKSIRLAVAILKSAAAHPAPDPVFFLNGGPGGNTLASIGPSLSIFNRNFLAGDRDLVLIDQRGTGYSQPQLQCTELSRTLGKIRTKRISLAQEATQEAQAVAACRARLVRQGIDLSAYTSPQNAADIADLRTALGYDKVNLYGVSYGTRLALTVMRYFPQGVRSVVLDSVYGPTINTFTDPERSAARSFNLVLDSCARSATCKKANPRLRNALYSLVKRFDAKPPTIPVRTSPGNAIRVVFTGEYLVQTIFSALYVASLIPRIPRTITEAFHGKYAALAALAQPFLASTPPAVNWGMYYSVECSEDAPGTTPADIDAASQSLPAPLRRDFTASFRRLFHDCQIWQVPGVSPAQKQPVVSDIPTMVMEGEYDPITPPEYGATVAKTLSHSYGFVYPGRGHGNAFSAACPTTMMRQFLDHPEQKPDDSCITQLSEPFGP